MSAATVPPGDTTETLAARAIQVTKVCRQGQTEVRALDNISVEFPSGRFTAIMGPSGSGQVDPDALPGRAGHDHLRADLHRRRRAVQAVRRSPLLRRDKVGFVFQAFEAATST